MKRYNSPRYCPQIKMESLEGRILPGNVGSGIANDLLVLEQPAGVWSQEADGLNAATSSESSTVQLFCHDAKMRLYLPIEREISRVESDAIAASYSKPGDVPFTQVDELWIELEGGQPLAQVGQLLT